MEIIIVNDKNQDMHNISILVSKIGHKSVFVNNSHELFSALKTNTSNIVILGLNIDGEIGLDICKKIRAIQQSEYIYIFLLLDADDKPLSAEGLKSGADYILLNPINKQLLDQQIKSVNRLSVHMQSVIIETDAIKEKEINNDLQRIANLQKSLLPKTNKDNFKNIDFKWLFLVTNNISNTLFNYFKIDEQNFAFYSLESQAKNLYSAILVSLLSQKMSMDLYQLYSNNKLLISTPEDIVTHINNDTFIRESGEKISMFYGVQNIETGISTVCNADFCNPTIINREKPPIIFETTPNPALGNSPNNHYQSNKFQLQKNDKLILHSDSIFSCKNYNDDMLDISKLHQFCEANRYLPIDEFMYELHDFLNEWQGYEFQNNIALLAWEWL